MHDILLCDCTSCYEMSVNFVIVLLIFLCFYSRVTHFNVPWTFQCCTLAFFLHVLNLLCMPYNNFILFHHFVIYYLFVYCFCLSFSARFCFAYVSGFFCTDLSTTSSKNHNNNNILVKPTPHPIKTPSWCQAQLKEAISCILTQQMRFTQASAKFKIPKGTLYDNILGKTKRSRMLEEIGLSCEQERAVLEFACDIVLMPYNRRTSRPLIAIVNFVKSIMSKHQQPPHSQQTTQQQQAHSQSSTTSSSAAPPPLPAGDDNSIFSSPPKFEFPIRKAFKWWWAFCKKYSVISLYYKEKSQNANVPIFEAEEEKATGKKSSSSSSSLQNQGNNNEQKQLCNSRTIFASTTADSNSSFSSSASSAAAMAAAAAAAYPIFYYPSPYFYALSDFNSQAYSTSTSVRKMK